jgi:hypothetical protein
MVNAKRSTDRVNEFIHKMRDYLNSQEAMDLIMQNKYATVESEVVMLRKKIIPRDIEAALTLTGYLDGIINRELLFRIYGMMVHGEIMKSKKQK